MTHHTLRGLLWPGLVAAALAGAGCGDGDGKNDPDAALPDAPPQQLVITEIAGDFATPESVLWDADRQVWYVTSFGQPFGDAEVPGFITKLSAEGVVVAERWIDNLIDPKGMALDRDRDLLYVADTTKLHIIDVDAGELAQTVDVPGAIFLNDVAVLGGVAYVTDTFANSVYRYSPDGEPEVLVQSEDFKNPNGITADGDKLIVAGIGSFEDETDLAPIVTVTTEGTVTPLGTFTGKFDGIERDGQGGYLVTEFYGKLHRVSAAGAGQLIVDLAADHGFMSSADLGFDPVSRTVVIPDLAGNKVYSFTLPQ